MLRNSGRSRGIFLLSGLECGTTTGDGAGSSPYASQETPTSAAGRLMTSDVVGGRASFAAASAVVVWSVFH